VRYLLRSMLERLSSAVRNSGLLLYLPPPYLPAADVAANQAYQHYP